MKHYFLGLGLLFLSSNSFGQEIEIHSHAFMNEGMTWGFKGEFDGPIVSKSWEDRFQSAMNPDTLNKSGLRVVVFSLYSHPLFVMNLRNSVEAQINLTKKFVKEHPDWILATNSDHALQAYDSGKKVIILAIEGASAIIENDKDIARFVDEGGIKIVTLLHLTDDDLGGVAILGGFKSLSSPIGWLLSLFAENSKAGVNINPRGLTHEGKNLLRKLLSKGVWVDLSHASDQSLADILPILEEANQPPLFTHTSLRRYLKAERGLSDEMLITIKERNGFLGLMPSQDFLTGTPPRAGFPEHCQRGVLQLVTHVNDALEVLPPEAIALGSDFHGGVEHLPQPCKELPYFTESGFHRIDQVPELWKALEAGGLKQIPGFKNSAREFLLKWKKAENNKFRN